MRWWKPPLNSAAEIWLVKKRLISAMKNGKWFYWAKLKNSVWAIKIVGMAGMEMFLNITFCGRVARTLSKSHTASPFYSVQFSPSVFWLFVTPWTAARQASVSISNSQSLLKLMSFESVMSSNHLILCHPLLLPPSIFRSIRGSFNFPVLWPLLSFPDLLVYWVQYVHSVIFQDLK